MSWQAATILPLRNAHRLPIVAAYDIAMLRRAPIGASRRVAWCMLATLSVAACVATPPAPTPAIPPARSAPIAPHAEPPPPNVNLSGFPLPYRQGYADGCASAGGAERKDSARFAADGNYRTGWQDGVALCRKK
jgi:hypothetical protein